MVTASPLRYPGGKSRFTRFISQSIEASGEQAKILIEPFCGGAGAAVALLESNRIERIALNDLDPLVSSFWKVAFGKTDKPQQDFEWLVRKVESAEVTVDEWRRLKSSNPRTLRAAAWKCLFVNRTSFNGILHKAGPIGGWQQKNRRLDVRFNREKLVNRLYRLYQLRERVQRVDGLSWQRFCSFFTRSPGIYLYLDPPYYHKAEQLYGYLFDERCHRNMRDYLIALKAPWMLSYDDAPEVRALYGSLKGIEGRVIDQTYSAHPVGGGSFIGRELFFSNRPLPPCNATKSHEGLSVIGCFREIQSVAPGPIRIPITRSRAIGA